MDSYLPPLTPRVRRWVRFLAVLACAFGLFMLARRLGGVLTPIAISLAIAYICNPLITLLEKRGIARPLSIGVGLAGLGVLVVLISVAGAAQVVQFARAAPIYAEQFENWLRTTIPGVLDSGVSREQLSGWMQEHGATLARTLLSYSSTVAAGVAYWGSAAVLIPMYSFFFLWGFNDMLRVIREHLPGAYRDTILRVVQTIDKATADFFRGRLVICAAVGLLTGVGWLIVGVPYSLPLGLLAGVFNLVPLLSIVVLPPALLLSYLDALQAGQNWILPVCLTMGVFMLVQAVESFALAPYVTAQSSGLHPVTTVVALLIGAELVGVLGMLLSIPIASTLKSLGKEYLLPEIRRLAQAPPAAAPEPAESTGGAHDDGKRPDA